jgi:hypothetical protein
MDKPATDNQGSNLVRRRDYAERNKGESRVGPDRFVENVPVEFRINRFDDSFEVRAQGIKVQRNRGCRFFGEALF